MARDPRDPRGPPVGSPYYDEDPYGRPPVRLVFSICVIFFSLSILLIDHSLYVILKLIFSGDRHQQSTIETCEWRGTVEREDRPREEETHETPEELIREIPGETREDHLLLATMM